LQEKYLLGLLWLRMEQLLAAAVIRLSDDTWVKLVSGGLSTEWAYMRGQLKISGSMGVALKMKAVLGIVGTISKS
jgi:putative sterol carrier protein